MSGHEFVAPSYQTQYGYASMQTVQNTAPHDMNKPVPAPQPAMYQNSVIPAQQHHQAMGSPVPNAQQTTLVQQTQQIRPGHMNIPGFYARNNMRTPQMPNMRTTQIQTVVNQAGQQPPSQYSHMPMISATTPFPNMQPVLMNPQYQLNVNYQRTFTQPPQNIFYQPQGGQFVLNQHYGPYNTPSQPSSNGYYQAPGIATYNAMPPAQQMPQQPTQQQKKRKALPIIDPKSGKNILEGMNEDDGSHLGSEKEMENADQSIGLQFAIQVAATLGEKNDTLSKSSSIEDTRVMDSQDVICSNEIDNVQNVEPEDSELGDIESLADNESDIDNIENRNIECIEETNLQCFKKEVEVNSIIETSYDDGKCDSVSANEVKDSNIYANLRKEIDESTPDPVQTSNLSNLSNQDITPVADCNYEVSEVQISEPIQHKTVETPLVSSSPNSNIEESTAQDPISEITQPISVSSNISSKSLQDKEGKKNKGKKKKDYNKKGENKEGGEMDAFLDKKEDVAPVPVSPVPTLTEDRSPSPPVTATTTIVDNEILSTIPLPGEVVTDGLPLIDASPDQPSETSSVSPSAESEDKENIDESAQSKVALKYNYKEGLWSPLNPEGKKQYDRNFLLLLQSEPMSLTKPQNLPNLDVIKDKAHIQKLNEICRSVPIPSPVSNYRDHFLPQYAQRGGGMPRMFLQQPPMNYNNRRALPGRDSKTKKVISLSQNVKLHEADNAWKPAYKQENPAEVSPTQLDKEKLKRSVQGILNKLTPQKFETLLSQLKNLNIDTEEKLTVVIDLIFEKAVDEPNFSVPYANMCKHLALLKVPTEKRQTVHFRKLLLTKCQKEFEKDRTDELKHAEKVTNLAEADTDKKKELKQEMYEEEKKMRYRQLGNIRFIGELFKLGMLIEPIMHECIKRLLSVGDEESLECLCKLLKTIGKELDEGKNKKESMDNYFTQMQKIVEKRLTSSRVRFMLQDVIDFKKNNWVPRRVENNPKTIDQIHKEAEREAREQQQVLQSIPFNKRVNDDRDRRKSTARNIVTSEEGWTSSTKSSRGSYSIVDPNKLKLTKPDEVDSIRLGPGRAMQSWGRGSSGGTKTTAGSSDPDKTTLQNRYSALAEQSSTSSYIENRRGSQRSAASSRESSRGRNTQLPPAIRKTPSTSKERDNVIEAVKGLVRSGASETKTDSRINSEPQLNGKTVIQTDLTELRLRGDDLPEELVEKRTKPLIDEFLHNNDLEEAVRCVTELASPNTIHMFINSAINQVLERSSQARHSLGQLLFSLVKQKIITFEQYKRGFACVLENVDEFALDIPLIWDYMGEILESMLEDNKFPLNFLKDVLEPCIPSLTAGILVSATLHCAAKKRGTVKLGELWRESNLMWTDFLGEKENVDDFIHKHKLEFTISVKAKPSTPMPIEEIKKNLLELLEKTEESEEIFDWIDENVTENQESNFIRALVTAVHENAISDTGSELDVPKLKKRISILTRYIDHNENLELQALYAIQTLMNHLNQPKGILRQIFDILYDDDVITEESFKRWEQSEDEIDGKCEALHSVKSFFTWLKETDSGGSVSDE